MLLKQNDPLSLKVRLSVQVFHHSGTLSELFNKQVIVLISLGLDHLFVLG